MASGNPDISSLIINPVRMQLWYEKSPIRFEAPWTGKGQVLRRWGRWRMVLEWEGLTIEQFDALFPLFTAYGSDTPFTIYNPRRPLPTGNALPPMDSLVVSGAGQTGQSLAVTGASPSTLIFRAGDFIGLGTTGQVFQVKSDCTANGSGNATISLCQYIAASPAHLESVIVSYVPFRMLMDSDPKETSIGPSIQSAFAVEMSEWL